MIYSWFKIFNLDEFEALNLVSKTYVKELVDIGLKSFLVTKGNMVSVTSDGVFLSLDMNAKNPFEFDSHAVWRNPENNDVYFGYLVLDET